MGNVKIGDWISEAWSIISEDLVTHIILALIVGLGSSITAGLLSGPLMGGYLWIVFNKMKNPSYKPEVGDIGKGFEQFVQLLLVGIVGGLIASLGTIACVVGVFVTSALVILAPAFVVERKLGFWEAITESINHTKQSLMGWVVFVLVVGLLNVLGGAVAVGFLITLPIMVVMIAIGYRDTVGLQGAAAAGGAAAAPT
ncbi:MAG: hypothetical protein GF393_01280, partial [Armatimonadia bacterium]|nr:hypothetical protein [Armatimonadia bacterium]